MDRDAGRAGITAPTRRRRRGLKVADAMITAPPVHPSSATVGELRAFFEDTHVHAALLVEDGRLVGTVERSDLAPELDAGAQAREAARLDGRTVAPDTALGTARTTMRRAGRRRLAVVTGDALVGLLCLKASGRGFCSDGDVAARGADGAPGSRAPHELPTA